MSNIKSPSFVLQIVTALNKKWHPEHFTCNTCRKPIDGAKFHQHDGGVHCVPCFAAHHSPRCHGCGEPITDVSISLLHFIVSKIYHNMILAVKISLKILYDIICTISLGRFKRQLHMLYLFIIVINLN